MPDESPKVAVAGNPCASMLDGDCSMLRIGDAVAGATARTAQRGNQFPMTVFKNYPVAVGMLHADPGRQILALTDLQKYAAVYA